MTTKKASYTSYLQILSSCNFEFKVILYAGYFLMYHFVSCPSEKFHISLGFVLFLNALFWLLFKKGWLEYTHSPPHLGPWPPGVGGRRTDRRSRAGGGKTGFSGRKLSCYSLIVSLINAIWSGPSANDGRYNHIHKQLSISVCFCL